MSRTQTSRRHGKVVLTSRALAFAELALHDQVSLATSRAQLGLVLIIFQGQKKRSLISPLEFFPFLPKAHSNQASRFAHFLVSVGSLQWRSW